LTKAAGSVTIVAMSTPVRRALAAVVVVSALGSALVWSSHHAERLQAAARGAAGDAAQAAARRAGAELGERFARVQQQAASFAALDGVSGLVKEVVVSDPDTLAQVRNTLDNAFHKEDWTRNYRDLGVLLLVVEGQLVFASDGRAALGPSLGPLAAEAETAGSARAVVEVAGTTALAGLVRLTAPTKQQGRAVVILLSPLTADQLAALATAVGGAVAVVGTSSEVAGGAPAQVEALRAFVRGGAPEGEPCCAVASLSPGVRAVVALDPARLLGSAEAEAATHRLVALGAAALASVVALFLGFRGGAPAAHAQLLQETAAELARSREELQRLSRLVPAASGPALGTSSVRATDPGLEQTHASATASRYVEVAPLGEGGMAKVSVAEVRGAEGFRRIFVLKRLRPELASNPEVVNQFIDEARLGASLVHSNIVPVFDFGRDAEGYFLAQEYILGRDVDALVQASRDRRGRAVEPELVLYLAQEALKALSYAHGRRDAAGRPLKLVHRDVSTANLMVSARGEVKLLDFGIVKGEQRLTRTQTGVVKGNLYFMSPEQARALEVDARSDLFSLGMVMYTAAAGQPLYGGNTTFELISRAGLGPGADDLRRVAALPGPLGPLIARALELDPARRYRDADEFAHAVAATGAVGTAAALQALMEHLFHDELGAESSRLTRATA
jgi:Protein kinase domain